MFVHQVIVAVVDTSIEQNTVVGEHRDQRKSGLIAHVIEILRECYVAFQREYELLDRIDHKLRNNLKIDYLDQLAHEEGDASRVLGDFYLRKVRDKLECVRS